MDWSILPIPRHSKLPKSMREIGLHTWIPPNFSGPMDAVQDIIIVVVALELPLNLRRPERRHSFTWSSAVFLAIGTIRMILPERRSRRIMGLQVVGRLDPSGIFI